MAEIKDFIIAITSGALEADDKSMYRALRRYNAAGLIDFTAKPGENGPDLKVYDLTNNGQQVLKAFSARNIINVFYKDEVQNLIEGGIKQ